MPSLSSVVTSVRITLVHPSHTTYCRLGASTGPLSVVPLTQLPRVTEGLNHGLGRTNATNVRRVHFYYFIRTRRSPYELPATTWCVAHRSAMTPTRVLPSRTRARSAHS